MTQGSTPSGNFGQRLIRWLGDVFGRGEVGDTLRLAGSGIFPQITGRVVRAIAYISEHPELGERRGDAFWYFVLTGQTFAGNPEAEAQAAAFLRNPSEVVGSFMSTALTDPVARELFESIGAAIYDGSVGAITGQAPPAGSAGAERARAFVGFVTALGAIPQALSALTEVVSLGQIDKIGDNIAQIYFNLGLGFLTWQTMAPTLEAAILQPLQRDVQRQWRGMRFSRAQVQELFALGAITRDQLVNTLKDEGWRDEDIDLVIQLAYRDLSRADLVNLWHNGTISAEQLAARLRAQGYSPDDVQLILSLEMREDVQDDRRESISILTNAFKGGLLPEADFRAALDAQGYTPREIDLRVQLIRFQQQSDARRLSTAQLKDAWGENILGDPEVLHRLAEMGYAESETEIILATWRAELAPDFLRINQSTVLDMYRFAILTRAQAKARLTSIGYNDDDADSLLDLQEKRYPEAFGAAPSRKRRALSLGAVVDLVAMGRLDDAGVRQWAGEQGFSDADVENMLTLIKERAREPARPLSQSTILDAYVSKIFNRATAKSALQAIGFSDADAETILRTVEAENPAVFHPDTVTAVRQPSITALVEATISGFIAEVEFFKMAKDIGFTQEGAQIYLANTKQRASRGSKKLTKADILEFYRKGLMDYSQARARLEEMGYTGLDADLLLRSEQKGVQNTDIWRAFAGGLLQPDAALPALLGLGFTEAEINAALEQFAASQPGA